MKYLSITLLFLFYVTTSIQAQSLRIVYLEEPDIEAQIKEIENPQEAMNARAQFEKMSRLTYLYYNNGESLYSRSNLSADNVTKNNDVMIVMDNNNTFYKDLKNGQGIASERIFERTFIIDEKLNTKKWNLLNESAKVAGYDCKKALDEEGNVVWYTMDIPISDGPENYCGLPGLVLKVKTPYMSLTANEITPDFSTKGLIEKPTHGKNVTREQYEQLFTTKMKELQYEYENGDH